MRGVDVDVAGIVLRDEGLAVRLVALLGLLRDLLLLVHPPALRPTGERISSARDEGRALDLQENCSFVRSRVPL